MFLDALPDVGDFDFRIWIDDERLMPSGFPFYNLHCKNFSELRKALELIEKADKKIDAVSFDFVLNNDPNWGYARDGLDCIEIVVDSQLVVEDAYVDFHSSDLELNVKMSNYWKMMKDMVG